MFNILELEYEPKNIQRKVYEKDDRVFLGDGDIIAYKTSAACEKRSIIVTNKLGKTKKFKTRTEFKKWCGEKGKSYDDYTIEDVQDAESIEFCLGTLKRVIKNAMLKTNTNKMELYVEGTGNFRKDLPLIDKYKDREGGVRPIHLKACKDYLVEHQGAIRIKGRETDDFFQQRLYELSKHGVYAIGYSNDKDSKQNYQFDINLYNPDNDEITSYKGGVGELWETSNGIKGNGLKWLMFQNFLYDKIDNYCMNQFYKKQFGEKSFYKAVAPLTTEKEVLQWCVDKWKELLPESIEYVDHFGNPQKHDWLSLAELYFQCCYMKIYDNDETSVEGLLIEYGVDYK